jgi:hypothetical protein
LSLVTLLAALCLLEGCQAFVVSLSATRRQTCTPLFADTGDGRNPDRPELPELKGDFNWDEAYAGDDDWITSAVPGKMVVDELALARQVTALTQLEDTWRKERMQTDYEAELKVGWVGKAELANGRFAMFFLVTGLLTELWTGVSLPGQVEVLLRVAGVIGFDG